MLPDQQFKFLQPNLRYIRTIRGALPAMLNVDDQTARDCTITPLGYYKDYSTDKLKKLDRNAPASIVTSTVTQIPAVIFLPEEVTTCGEEINFYLNVEEAVKLMEGDLQRIQDGGEPIARYVDDCIDLARIAVQQGYSI